MDKMITQSASKLTLLTIVATLNAITLFAVCVSIWRGTLEGKEVLALFSTSASLVIGYYFGRASSAVTNPDTGVSNDPNQG